MKWISKLLFILTFFMSSAFTEENETMQKERPILEIETTDGPFKVVLFPEVAPKACENFIKLAEKNYYNQTKFHRIIPNFMIQGGDPKGTGTGGDSIWGGSFEDEFKPDLKFDKPGFLAMANAGANTNRSQFFITTTSTPWLNMKHTIFGEVIEGYDVIKKIEAVGSANGRPSKEVQIVKITVVSPIR